METIATLSRHGWLLSPAPVFLALGLLVAPSSLQAVTLSLDPGSATRTVGQTVSLDLAISGLGDNVAPSLGAFDITASFDPSILAFTSMAFGDPGLGNLLGPVAGTMDGFVVDAGLGTVNLFSVSLETVDDLNNTQPGQFILGTLSFLALAPGISDLTLGSILLSDASGAPLDAVVQGAKITVNPHTTVPDGGSWPSGLFMLGFAVTSALGRSLRTRTCA